MRTVELIFHSQNGISREFIFSPKTLKGTSSKFLQENKSIQKFLKTTTINSADDGDFKYAIFSYQNRNYSYEIRWTMNRKVHFLYAKTIYDIVAHVRITSITNHFVALSLLVRMIYERDEKTCPTALM